MSYPAGQPYDEQEEHEDDDERSQISSTTGHPTPHTNQDISIVHEAHQVIEMHDDEEDEGHATQPTSTRTQNANSGGSGRYGQDPPMQNSFGRLEP